MPIRETLSNIFTRKESKPGTNAKATHKGYNYNHLYTRQTTGLSYTTYKNIMKDSQVKVGLEILKYFLISKNYTISSNSDDPKDIEIADFIRDCLDNMEIPFREVIKNVLTAMRYGFSVQEKVYTLNNDNRIAIKGLYPIHIRTLQSNPFNYNEDGELEGIHQQSDFGSVDLRLNKVLLYSFDKEFDEMEGNSILNEIKPIVDDKEDTMDWLMTFASKNENPVLYGKTSDKQSRDNMLIAFDDIADGNTGMVIGRDDEIGVLESSHRGETFFKILQYKDNQIFRRMFIGNLLLGDNSQTGSYAQIYGQQDFMLYIMDGILSDVAQIFQKDLVNELTTMNFGSNAKAPNFSFEKFSKKDVLNLLNAIKGFIDNGSFDSDNQGFKELLATAFLTEADIKLDLESIENTNQTLENETNFDYQPPLEGATEVQDLVDTMLEGIV